MTSSADDVEFDHSLRFLSRRAVAGLESVEPTRYTRTISIGTPALLRVKIATARVSAMTDPALPRGQPIRLARRIFDLDVDRSPFLRLARTDRYLGPLVSRRPGLRRVLLADPFEAAVRAIVGQLISVAAATTVLTRLVQAFGTPVPSHQGWLAFPTADRLAGAGRRLATIGLTSGKVTALTTLARHTVANPTLWSDLLAQPGAIDIALEGLPGIGPWTRDYIRYRGLGDCDAFLATDLGIVKAMDRLGVPTRELNVIADGWRPWRALAIPILWASLDP